MQSLEVILAQNLVLDKKSLESSKDNKASESEPDKESGKSSEDSKASESRTDQQIRAILELVDSVKGAANEFQSKPQIERVNSLLIAIIEQRQKKDMATLDIKRQRDLLDSYQKQHINLLIELSQLADTKILLNRIENKDKRFIGGFAQGNVTREIGLALSFYVTSWNEGQIPYYLLLHKEVQIDRAYHAEMAQRTEKNFKDFLEPVYGALAAYGEGGIHPQTIATLITNLGLIAAFAAR